MSDDPAANGASSDRDLFGFDSTDDAWLDVARDNLAESSFAGIGPYDILEEVARGSQGVVFRARQVGMGRDIALKRMIAGSFSSESTRERFRREVEAIASLHHPGIVTVHGLEIDGDVPVMAMEWIDGAPIVRWARPKDGPPRGRREVMRAFLELCSAVRHAHQNGVLHRDLKPSNVLVSPDGHPHVLDFGLAKQLDAVHDVSISREFVGTLAYASPEQIAAKRLDVRSDVYSLGVILYEALIGERPYRPEEGIPEFLSSVERDSYVRPSSLRPELEPEIDWIVKRALAADRDERYQTAAALEDDVRAYLTGDTVRAHPPSIVYDIKKVVARNQTVSTLALVLIVGSVSGAFFFAQQAVSIAKHARDAEAARDSEAVARQRAEDALAMEAQQRRSVQLAWRETFTTLRFLREDVLLAADHGHSGPETTLADALRAASDRVGVRLANSLVIQAFVRRNLGEAQWRLGLYEDASSELEQSIAITLSEGANVSTAEARVVLGGMRLEQGRLEEARRLLDATRGPLSGYPERDQTALWRALKMLVDVHLGLGNLRRAEEALLELEAVDPQYWPENPGFLCDVVVRRARYRAATRDVDGARALLAERQAECEEDAGRSSRSFAELLLTRAELALEQDDAEEALPLVFEALGVLHLVLRPQHPRTLEAEALFTRVRDRLADDPPE